MVIDRLCNNPGVAVAAAVASTAGDGWRRYGPAMHLRDDTRVRSVDRPLVRPGHGAVLPPLDGNQGSLPIAAGGGAGRRSPKNAGRLLNLEYR